MPLNAAWMPMDAPGYYATISCAMLYAPLALQSVWSDSLVWFGLVLQSVTRTKSLSANPCSAPEQSLHYSWEAPRLAGERLQ